MLDPAKRKCHLCYENQDKWGIPIPNCSDPDGEGLPCEYPTVERSLLPENRKAWELWAMYPEQILGIQVGLGGATYTLNLDSFRSLCRMNGVQDMMGTYRKVRVIFNEWRRIEQKEENPKTKKSMDRTRQLKRRR